jgi:hypothetical protein
VLVGADGLQGGAPWPSRPITKRVLKAPTGCSQVSLSFLAIAASAAIRVPSSISERLRFEPLIGTDWIAEQPDPPGGGCACASGSPSSPTVSSHGFAFWIADETG